MPFTQKASYIVRGRSSYHLQRLVPKDCKQFIGKSKWTEPGGTLSQARAKVPGFLARTDAEIREARGEQLTPEEWMINAAQKFPEQTKGLGAYELVEMAAPRVDAYLDNQGTPNPEFVRLHETAKAVKAGEANALLTVEGLLLARRLDREPAPRTYEGWKRTLLAFMAFTGRARPGLCTPADAESYKDHLLQTSERSTAKTAFAYLAGLWSTLIAKEGVGENIHKPIIPSLGETTKTKALKAAESKRFKSFEPTTPIDEWTGSKYIDVFKILYYSGCRLAEVAGLAFDDIHDDYCSAEWYEDRSLKTANSVRDIPIHPAIKPMMNGLRDSNSVGNVWPSLMTVTHVDGIAVVRWGMNLAKPCKKITGLRPKDFRDRVIGQLRSKNFNQVLIERLSGHSASTMNSTYGGADWKMYEQMVEALS